MREMSGCSPDCKAQGGKSEDAVDEKGRRRLPAIDAGRNNFHGIKPRELTDCAGDEQGSRGLRSPRASWPKSMLQERAVPD
jgi:hypothetical protein